MNRLGTGIDGEFAYVLKASKSDSEDKSDHHYQCWG